MNTHRVISLITGKEVSQHTSYWDALRHGYCTLRMGNFTVEPL